MWDDFEDPVLVEVVMIAAIFAVVASVIFVLVLHFAEQRHIESHTVPAVMEASSHGQ